MITIVIPHYNQPQMYDYQIKHLKTLNNVRIIIVDDYSDIKPEPYFETYYITEDMGINWQGSKNLGVMKSKTDWVLLTDLDHIIPQETIDQINIETLDPDTIYTFKRKRNGVEIHSHPNTFLINRDLFIHSGGFDLRLQGTRLGDTIFVNRFKKKELPLFVETIGTDKIKDSKIINENKQDELIAYQTYLSKPPQPLINFTYENNK